MALQTARAQPTLYGHRPNSGNPLMRKTGRLTTHVLDTAHGRPARGMAVRLFRQDGGEAAGQLLIETETNEDGRCPEPLLTADAMKTGRYRLEFDAAGYFRAQGTDLPDPAFLDTVVICFGIADRDVHYHVPLLISPFGYSTYRGS